MFERMDMERFAVCLKAFVRTTRETASGFDARMCVCAYYQTATPR
jgi:hypothetical protein